MEDNNVKLVIALPNKVLPAEEVYRVVIPAAAGPMTVLQGQAPHTVLLTNGVMDILDEDNQSVKKYFVKGGVANIAADECVISTEKVIGFDDINTARSQVLKHEHQKELATICASIPGCSKDMTDSDIDFYEYIFYYLVKYPQE